MSSSSSSSSTTIYWATATRVCESRDIGHTCKECKKPFTKIGEPLGIRRGGRLEFRYHASCMTNDVDPRSQQNSSYNNTANGTLVAAEAPKGRFNKMKTSSHF